jgi:dinuclear metal center YbgI/SA1388 family protein
MRLTDFLAVLEEIAPSALAQDWDNVGLLIGTERAEIRHVLVALDATLLVVQEAVDKNADLLLCHHPLFFQPVRQLLPDAPQTAAAWHLARHNIAMVAAHTNLDAARGGVNDCLADCLDLQNVRSLPPEHMGRVGELPLPLPLGAFLQICETRLDTQARFVGDPLAQIRTVALLGGAGGDALQAAKRAGADVLLTGEAKHHEALEAELRGIALAALGHYETERLVLSPWIARLQGLTNGVQYTLSSTERAVLRSWS